MLKKLFLLIFPALVFAQDISKVQIIRNSIDTTEVVSEKVQLYTNLAWEYTISENDSALIFAEKALILSKKNNYKLGEAIALETKGLFEEIVNGDYNLASQYYFEGIRLCEKNNLNYATSIYHSLGVMFHTSDNYEKAAEYYAIAYDRAKTEKNILIQKKCLVNLGAINSTLKNYSKAEKLLLESLTLKVRKDFDYSTYANLGNLYLRQKQYQKAVPYFEHATEQHPDNYDSEENLYFLINVKAALKDSVGMKSIIKRAVEFTKTSTMNRSNSLIEFSLSNYYRQFGEFEKALEHRDKYLKIYEEIKEKQRDQTVYELEAKYQTEKKKKEILNLKQEQDILNTKQQFNTLFIYAILVVFGMFLFFLRYRNNKRKALFKQELEIKNQVNKITHLKLENEENKGKHYVNELNQFMKLMKIKNDQIKELELRLKEFPEQIELESKFKEKIHQLYTTTILTDDDWKTFRIVFDQVHPKFIQNLSKHFPSTSSGDLKMGSMLKLNLSNTEISSIFGISPESVRKNKYRFRKKLNFKTDEALQGFINQL
ncbi:MAG: tetratricopeptide repeat protein [Urechidicola sp.]|nr:tetratricopeptide repeat protein [Urechidicola sp.]